MQPAVCTLKNSLARPFFSKVSFLAKSICFDGQLYDFQSLLKICVWIFLFAIMTDAFIVYSSRTL